MDILAPLAHATQHLTEALTIQERRKLLRSIATRLRTRNRDRIKRNVDPDGHPFVPRKREQRLLKRRGLMFKKLSPYIRSESSDSMAAVGIYDRLGRKMRVHQLGEIQQPTIRAKPHQYPKRELLGFSADDIALIDEMIIQLLSNLGMV